MHDGYNQITCKSLMLRSSLCDYIDAYILVKGTVTVANSVALGQPNNGAIKKVIFKNCAAFTSCVSSINNTQVDDAQYIDVVMPMYNVRMHERLLFAIVISCSRLRL